MHWTGRDPTMSDRDYVTEMRAVIDAATQDAQYRAGDVARDIVEKLQVNDPDLLHGWLTAQAPSLIRDAIVQRDASHRSYVRHHGSRSVFAAAAAAHAAGDPDALVGWLGVRHVVSPDGTRKRLADMTADDLRFSADTYRQRVRENALAEAFLRHLAQRVGSGTVADRYTDEQLDQIWTSLGRPD